MHMKKHIDPKQARHCWEYHECLNEVKKQCIVYELGIETECWSPTG